jgi:hypothetical protein
MLHVMLQPRLGEVAIIFSEAELDDVLKAHKDDLVVLEASLTWCRPCKGFEPSYKVSCLSPRLGFRIWIYGSRVQGLHCVVQLP